MIAIFDADDRRHGTGTGSGTAWKHFVELSLRLNLHPWDRRERRRACRHIRLALGAAPSARAVECAGKFRVWREHRDLAATEALVSWLCGLD